MKNNYNIGARYEIIGRVTKGTSVLGYLILDKSNNTRGTLEKAVVEQLALNKQIYNCTAQVYGNIVNLKGINCKLNQLPKFTMDGQPVPENDRKKKRVVSDLKLVGKVQKGRAISDYVVIDLNDPNTLMKIPRSLVLKLAQDGRFSNATVQMNGNEIMLRGVSGSNLSQLQTYK